MKTNVRKLLLFNVVLTGVTHSADATFVPERYAFTQRNDCLHSGTFENRINPAYNPWPVEDRAYNSWPKPYSLQNFPHAYSHDSVRQYDALPLNLSAWQLPNTPLPRLEQANISWLPNLTARNMDDIRSAKRKRKPRTKFSYNQLQKLEQQFLKQPYLPPDDRNTFSMELGLCPTVVMIWFKNRRAKLRAENEKRTLYSDYDAPAYSVMHAAAHGYTPTGHPDFAHAPSSSPSPEVFHRASTGQDNSEMAIRHFGQACDSSSFSR